MLLILLLVIPLIGLFTIFVTNLEANPDSNIYYPRRLKIKRMKVIALTSSIINLMVSLVIFGLFNLSSNQFQFVQEYHQISSFDFYLGVDGLSIYFVLLTTIIIPISLLSN